LHVPAPQRVHLFKTIFSVFVHPSPFITGTCIVRGRTILRRTTFVKGEKK
jgi:hypothetical protein